LKIFSGGNKSSDQISNKRERTKGPVEKILGEFMNSNLTLDGNKPVIKTDVLVRRQQNNESQPVF
jgi:hypothetical protein